MAEVAQVAEHADRPFRPPARAGLNQIAHRLIERDLRVAEVIFASEPGDVGPVAGPERVKSKNLLELGEVQVDQEETVAELVLHRQKPAVPDEAFVDAAIHQQREDVFGCFVFGFMSGRKSLQAAWRNYPLVEY
jgi:hypothetical protein